MRSRSSERRLTIVRVRPPSDRNEVQPCGPVGAAAQRQSNRSEKKTLPDAGSDWPDTATASSSRCTASRIHFMTSCIAWADGGTSYRSPARPRCACDPVLPRGPRAQETVWGQARQKETWGASDPEWTAGDEAGNPRTRTRSELGKPEPVIHPVRLDSWSSWAGQLHTTASNDLSRASESEKRVWHRDLLRSLFGN